MNNSPERIHILGAGGHAKVAIRAAQLSGATVAAVFDDAEEKIGTTICGVPVIGKIDEVAAAAALPALIAIGDNRRRMQLAEQLDLEWATVIHPQATIDASVRIGVGTLVLAGAVVQVDAELGEHVIVNDNATVEHDCRVASGAHVSCNACLAGGALVDEGAMIGINAAILPGVRVGRSAVVGAGAVVVKDLQQEVTAVGVPAQVVGLRSAA